jgi:hypothetical protein
MAGYFFYSMSNNALDAYRRGEKPMSKWTKKAILQRLEEQFEVKEEHLTFFRSLSLSCLRKKLLVECGWHHTSKYFNITEFYDVDYDEDEDYIEDVDVYDNVFKIKNWFQLTYDKSRRAFKAIRKKQFEEAQEKHYSRIHYEFTKRNPIEEFKHTMDYFAEIPYVYEGNGYDHFNRYQRPCSNGIGYVAICPGKSGNNFYTDNMYAVKALKRKYSEWRESNPDVEQIADADLRERLASRKRRLYQ